MDFKLDLFYSFNLEFFNYKMHVLLSLRNSLLFKSSIQSSLREEQKHIKQLLLKQNRMSLLEQFVEFFNCKLFCYNYKAKNFETFLYQQKIEFFIFE